MEKKRETGIRILVKKGANAGRHIIKLSVVSRGSGLEVLHTQEGV